MFEEIFNGLNVYVDRLIAYAAGISDFWALGSAEFGYECNEETKVERKYDKRRLLKIKLKSLMEEVKIIRHEEEKLKPAARRGSAGVAAMINEMAVHRRKDIRDESRATLLAYNFIRGRTYEQTEPNVKPQGSTYIEDRVQRVLKMCKRYGGVPNSLADCATLEVEVRKWLGVNEKGVRVVYRGP